MNFFISTKYFYPSQRIEFNKNEEPIIWNLNGKNINEYLTLTFLFKKISTSNFRYSFLSFGYNNLLYEKINIFSYRYIVDVTTKLTYHSLRLGGKSNLRINLSNDNYYYIFLEIQKIPINDSSYKFKYTMNFGNYFNNNNISFDSKIIENINFEQFVFNLGSGEPREKVRFDFVWENLLIQNKQLTSYEKSQILLGNSNPLLFIDFSNSLIYSQYFYNKIDNDFIGGINGNSINKDKFDLFHEYKKNSLTQIIKKLYIFNMRQYIKLPQNLIKYFESFDISNYLVYLKITILLNNSNAENNLNINYKLYNRNNKSGININLIKINTTKKFEFNISLIEDLNNYHEITSNNEKLNIDYLILRYEKNLTFNKYKNSLNYWINSNNFELIYNQIDNNFLSTDNHYIGDYNTNRLDWSYILLEIEEVLIGKGTYLENWNSSSNTDNIIYDEINLFCHNINENKILRNNLNTCVLRNEIININNDCELSNEISCIFKLPDYNENDLQTAISSNFNTLLNSMSSNNWKRGGRLNPNNNVTSLNFINSLNSVLSSFSNLTNTNSSTINTSNLIFKPYRQIFTNPPNINININLNNNMNQNYIEYNYSTNFNLNNNNIIIQIIFSNTNNILGNIFEIEFNGEEYSNFVINKNSSCAIISVEIKNNNTITNPSIKITNLSGSHQFTILTIILLEVSNSLIDNINEKFFGEKISDNYGIIKNKSYGISSISIINYRLIDNMYINCNSSCNECNGPNNNNCVNCDNNYLNYNNKGCLLKNAKNCLSYGTNPSFCLTCNVGNQKIWIDNNRVFCFQCHSDCLPCDSFCNTCSDECKNCYLLNNKNNINCNSCPFNCFYCNKNCDTCYGDWKSNCYKCSDPNKKINKNYPYDCINCTKQGIIYVSRKEICDECHSSCKKCFSRNSNACTECHSGYILYNDNRCKLIIPTSKCSPNHVFREKNITNFYERVDKCIKCGQGCNSCLLNNLKNCNDCLYGYHLINNECIRCNENGQYINFSIEDTNNQPICSLCHSSCKKCISNLENNCISCYDNHYLLNIENNLNKCTLCNDSGYYKKDIYCKKCNEKCFNCINNSNYCTSCINGYLLNEITNECIDECKIGTYKNGNNCSKCHNNCISCNNGNEFSCIDCISGLYLHNDNNQCVLCNKLNNILIKEKCYNCHINCRNCFGMNSNECLSCNENLFLLEKTNVCVDICPVKTYKIEINNLYYCRNCHYSCLNCINSFDNGCLDCDNNLIYNKYTKKCLQNCEKGYYLINNNCEKCNINCINCISKNECLECDKNFYLKDNYCTTCKEKGYFINNKNCLKCDSNCLDCINYDNCLECDLNKLRIYNKIKKKYYCQIKCENDKIFNLITNKCINCNECDNCQIENEYFCEKCSHCKNNCIFDFKFNETGLYFFNKNNNFNLNNTIFKNDNINLIESFNILSNNYFYKIKNNIDELKKISLNFSNMYILKNKNCTYKKNEIINLNKTYEKNCSITKINYDLNNKLLNIKFNFKLNEILVKDNFSYKIGNTKGKIIDYIINNITYINENEINFNFIPNYFKSKFEIIIIFKDSIIKELNCKNKDNISKNYLIESNDTLFYESEINNSLNKIKNVLNKNSTISKNLEKAKPVIDNSKNGVLGTVFVSSFFSQFLSLLIRFFQVVYILDYISILKINLGEYTNTFLSYINFDLKLYIELNKNLNISKKEIEKKLSNILYINPKLKDFEFIYLTNLNIEFIFSLILLMFENISKLIIYLIKYKRNNYKIKEIKKNKNKLNLIKKINENFKNKKFQNLQIIKTDKINLKRIIILKFKIRSMRFTYIGTIFPNIVSSLIIYSQIFHEFTFNSNDLKIIIIFIIYYFFLVSYIKEVILAVKYHILFNTQKTFYEYRNDFFLFNNEEVGIHNYFIIFNLLRDLLILLCILLINIPIMYQLLFFFLIQLIYVILLFLMKSRFDYKKIQLFKFQEIMNFLLISNTFILYFTKFELFQFSFIIFYVFLIIVSIINLLIEVSGTIFYQIKLIYLAIKFKIIKNKRKKTFNIIYNK